MNCMKCGREILSSQAFCDGCLEHMAQNPVKSDIVVQLPNRPGGSAKRPTPRRKTRTPEEQIVRLKKSNRCLAVIVALLLLLSIFLALLSIDFFRQLDVQRFLGQNFATAETIK